MSKCKYFDRGDDKNQMPICLAPIPECASWNHVGGAVSSLDCDKCTMYEKKSNIEALAAAAIERIEAMSVDELEAEFNKYGYFPTRKQPKEEL